MKYCSVEAVHPAPLLMAPLLSEAEVFGPLEHTEKQSRETHRENVANVPFLSVEVHDLNERSRLQQSGGD